MALFNRNGYRVQCIFMGPKELSNWTIEKELQWAKGIYEIAKQLFFPGTNALHRQKYANLWNFGVWIGDEKLSNSLLFICKVPKHGLIVDIARLDLLACKYIAMNIDKKKLL